MDDENVAARPASTLPSPSRAMTESDTFEPTLSARIDGVIEMLTTGAFETVTVTEALFPSDVAVIVAVPLDTPVTTPVAETAATDEFEELQVTVRPVSTVPLPSFVVAVICCD